VDEISIRELRREAARVLDQVTRGASLTVTRDGHPLAELRPLARRPLDAATLLGRWRWLPVVDAARLRADIARGLDGSL
jgi:prevent-host-death family protein